MMGARTGNAGLVNTAAGRVRPAEAETLPLQVYTPHRLALPRARPYLSELWRRRHFALHLTRTELRAQHVGTVFGQLWLVLNPLLLAGVYFVLVDILREGQRGPEFLAHLVGTLFAFHFFSTCVSQGAKSVVRGGRLILNTAFPRSLLPLAAVLTALVRFLPTMAVYAVVHLAAGMPVGLASLWAVPVFFELVVFATGVSMAVAAAQVYFRDLANFLPYLLRIWLYVSPVLYFAHELPDRLQPLLTLNPLFPVLAAWSSALVDSTVPSAGQLLQGAAWALGALVLGALFFVSREREFAVRL
jgi:teichoic acid transport system permease protein